MNVLALDIGGANLKAAHGHVNDQGVSDARAASLPFALYRRPDLLVEKLKEIGAKFSSFDALAVTMTAELCDCFEGRRSGVHHVLDAVKRFAGEKRVGVWMTEGRFATIAEARDKWLACASANWHAQATWVANLFPHECSLLIDTGSTTTDITLLDEGVPRMLGRTDQLRLTFGELIYTGVRRTPLMSLAPLEDAAGSPVDPAIPLMAEYFATSADAYVTLADIEPQANEVDTADGRPLTREASRVRLLRMMGMDAEQLSQIYIDAQRGEPDAPPVTPAKVEKLLDDTATRLATACARRQEQLIGDGVHKVLHWMKKVMGSFSRSPQRVIISGSGAFLARRAAERSLPTLPVVTLADQIGAEASGAACAWSLVHLWRERT